jgi:DNA ligase-1
MAALTPFAELCRRLSETTKKLEKRQWIAEYLRLLPIDDAARAALYLSGTPFSETDPRKLSVGGALLGKAITRLSGASPEALHQAYLRHGDLGSAAFDLLPPAAPSLTLAEVDELLTLLASARGPTPRLRLLLDVLARATPLEAKYIIKLIAGDMRTGVKQALVEEAIAEGYSAPIAAVRRAVMLNGSLAEVVGLAAGAALDTARMRLFHPLGFMLASPVDSVEEALARFAEEIVAEKLEEGAAATAEPPEQFLREAQIEDKYDGMRAQLHCGDAAEPGRVGLFSRNREDLSASFPELIEAFAGASAAAILDGEILAWAPEIGRARPFAILQQRLGRKRVTAEMREQMPVVFMAFDLLYEAGADGGLLFDAPLSERRERLASLVERLAPDTAGARPSAVQQGLFAETPELAGFPRLVLAPAISLISAAQLDQAYLDARARGNEGVMLKARASLYQPGRRGLAWLKLKRELATLDVVVTGAEFGNGRRAGTLSDYTFAVRDGEQLLNVGKAYSGLTDVEIAELSAFFHEHTLEDYGSFRTVEPLLVLEVAFNNVMRSERHASGFALRFPRILRIRRDKPVEEIDTLARVEEIYNSQPDKPAS